MNMLKDRGPAFEFDTLLQRNGCRNVITNVTTVCPNYHSLIGLFITNFDPDCCKAGVLSYDMNDHFPIFLCINSNRIKFYRPSSDAYFRKISPKPQKSLGQDISSTNWEEIVRSEDPEKAYDMFVYIFKLIYIANISYIRSKMSRKTRKPWVTPELLSKMNIQNNLYQKFFKTRLSDDFALFKSYRNQFSIILNKAKISYYNNYFRANW